MTEQHEIRVDGERSWCETCGWNDVTHGYYTARMRAFFHFSRPEPADHDAPGDCSPSWDVCEFGEWPDRVWPAGRPGGDRQVTDWPRPATWEWELRGPVRDWVLACDEHEALGPSSSSQTYKHRLHAA